jgi:hypothetical protein
MNEARKKREVERRRSRLRKQEIRFKKERRKNLLSFLREIQ